jgi:hypothetical protein
MQAGKQPVRANYGTLLNSKVFDLGATANEGILCSNDSFGRVFEICPLVRMEDSFTYRCPCEFRGLDVEMEIKKHYFEVYLLLADFGCL